MSRFKFNNLISLALITLISVIFFVAYLIIARIDMEKLVLLSKASIPLILLAAMLRIISVAIHGLELYASNRATGVSIPIRKCVSIAFTAAGLEYIIPLGGATEVYKIAKISSYTSIQFATCSVAIQRLVISLSIVLDMTMLFFVSVPTSIFLLLIVSSIVLLVSNIGLTYLSRCKRFWRYMNKVIGRIRIPISMSLDIDFKKLNLRWFIVAYLLAVIERIAIALTGYLAAYSLGIYISFATAMVVFDYVQVVLWLLPVITPGNVGVYELLQFLALSMNNEQAAILPLLYRMISTFSLLPIAIPRLVSEGVNVVTKIVKY